MRPTIRDIFVPVTLSLSLAACAQGEYSVDLPDPTGVYEVGVTTATLVDHDRVERFDRDEGPRRLTVTAWYPAAPTGDEARAPLLLDLDSDDIRKTLKGMGLPGGVADAMAVTETAAWRDAARSDAREAWPVLLFSHGFLAVPELYTAAATELASHGYVVVSINHPYESSAAAFASGEVVEGKLGRFLFRIGPQMLGMGKLSEMAAGPEKAELTQKKLEKNTLLDESLDVWLADSRFVLDRLEDLAAGELHTLAPLAGGLDLEHVGAFGHSFGGATALALPLEDDRIDAAINWDGFQFGDVYGREIPVPALLMESAQLPGVNEMILAASPEAETVTFSHVLHLGMSDLAFVDGLSDRKRAKLAGEGDVRGDMRETIELTRAHMDAYVGAPAGLE